MKINFVDNCNSAPIGALPYGTVVIDPQNNNCVCIITTIPAGENDVAVVDLATGSYYDINYNAEVIIPQNAVLNVDR